MQNLECRAAAFGAARLFGDTLRSNDAMISLARKSGFAFAPARTTGSWCAFEKQSPAPEGYSLRKLADCRGAHRL